MSAVAPLKPKSAKPGGSSTARALVHAAALAAEPDPAALVSVYAVRCRALPVAEILHTHPGCLTRCSNHQPLQQLPGDLPSACPFATEWQPVVFAVQAAEGISWPALRDALRQLRVLQHLSLPDLAACMDPADALSTELQAAATAAEGARCVHRRLA
jgi:hypothetical protein